MAGEMKTYDIRISRDPEIVVLCGMKRMGRIMPGVTSHNFFEQIIKKYQRIVIFSRLRLHFLFFPGVSQSVMKNLWFNFSLMFSLNIFQRAINNVTNPSISYSQISPLNYIFNYANIHKTLFSALISNVVNTTRKIFPLDVEVFKPYFDIFMMENHRKSSKNRTATRGSLAFTPISWSHYTLPVRGIFQYGNQHAEPRPLYIQPTTGMTQIVQPSNEHIIEKWISNHYEKYNTLFTLMSSPYLVLSGAKFFHYSSIHDRLRSFLRTHSAQFVFTDLFSQSALFKNAASMEEKRSMISNMLDTTYKNLYTNRIETMIFKRFLGDQAMHEKDSKEDKHNCPNAKKGDLNFKKVLRPIAVNSVESSKVDRMSVHNIIHSVHRNNNLGYAGQKYIRGISSFTELIHRDLKGRPVKSDDTQLPDITRFQDVKNIVRDIDHTLTYSDKSLSDGECSTFSKRNRSSDLIYFNLNQSPSPSDTIHINPISSQKTSGTDVVQSLSIPEYQLYSLTDKVYRLIVERIRREKEMRGR
jgi:hypothetical protein